MRWSANHEKAAYIEACRRRLSNFRRGPRAPAAGLLLVDEAALLLPPVAVLVVPSSSSAETVAEKPVGVDARAAVAATATEDES